MLYYHECSWQFILCEDSIVITLLTADNNNPSLCLFRPDLIDFENLKRSNAHYNLQNAFNVAEKELGLTKLLDPEGEQPQSPQKHDAFVQVTLTV